MSGFLAMELSGNCPFFLKSIFSERNIMAINSNPRDNRMTLSTMNSVYGKNNSANILLIAGIISIGSS
jgi:hypothetical protein